MIQIWFQSNLGSIHFQIWIKKFNASVVSHFKFKIIQNAIKHIEKYYELTRENEYTFKGKPKFGMNEYNLYFKLFDTKSKKFLTILSPWYVGLKHDRNLV